MFVLVLSDCNIFRTVMRVIFFIVLFSSCPIYCKESIAALILARGGSKGVRLKNLQAVGGISLLTRAILTAKQAGLNDVTVSTDHPLIALESIKCGASVLRRNRITATDWAPSIWGVSEFMNKRKDIGILILIQATSPFNNSEHLRKAIRKLQEPVPYDCVFSVTRDFKLRWHDVNERVLSVNFDPDRRPRKQDWNGELLETGAFYIMRKALIDEGKLQNNNCTVWEVSAAESLEIDTYHDLEVANVLLKYNLV